MIDCIDLYRLCVIFTIAHISGTCVVYKLTSGGSNFIFTVVMKMRVKLSVFVSKFQLFDIGCLFRCRCSGTLQKFNGHPCIVPTLA